jgi:hypothetical protein
MLCIKESFFFLKKQAALATKTGCSGQMVPKVTKMVQNVTKWCRKLPKRILFLKCYQMVPTTKHSFFKKTGCSGQMVPKVTKMVQNVTKWCQPPNILFLKNQAALAKWCRKLPKWYKMLPNGANHQTFFF